MSPFEQMRPEPIIVIPSPVRYRSSSPTPSMESFQSSLPSSPISINYPAMPRPPSPPRLTPVLRSLTPAPTERHPQFYIIDDMAVFLVEGCLFRVHRFFLDRESKIFPKSFGLQSIITLPSEVTRFEFESLLNLIYNGMHTKYTSSLAEWTAILSISTRFEMADIRKRAIAEISKVRSTIDPVEQVVLAVTHDVPEWLPDAYVALSLRKTPITLREMKQLGDETMILVAEAREAVLKAKLEAKDPPRSNSPQKAETPQPFGHASNPMFGLRSTLPLMSVVSSAGQKVDPPISDDSLARRIVDEVFWREKREQENLEKQRKLRGVREAKEKAALQLMELERVLGGSEDLKESAEVHEVAFGSVAADPEKAVEHNIPATSKGGKKASKLASRPQ